MGVLEIGRAISVKHEYLDSLHLYRNGCRYPDLTGNQTTI